VAGKVSDGFGALGTGVFQIDDGTGRLWVFSQNYGVPGSGAKVAVTGRLQQGFSFGGRSFALALRQTQARH
jgi:X-X-X-Leu-X-X-Gly heptad repeat protein